jgi:uncharacterized delta-60 repeat protein
MRKWILWMVVVSIMISMMTGCNNSSSNLSGYSPATGVLDTTFDEDGILVHNNAAGGNDYDKGNSIYVDSTGKIYVTGNSYNGNNTDMVIWRYNSDGTLDNTFGNNGIVVHDNATGGNSYDEGNSIFVDSIGKIYVTGGSWNGSNYYMVIWRYNSDGTLDNSFGNNGIVVHHNAAGGNSFDYGNSIFVDSNGKIYVTGYSYSFINTAMVIWKYK